MNFLFIGPRFNGYEKTITNTIKKHNKYNKVYFVQDCPLRSTHLYALLYNLFPSLKIKFLKYYNNRLVNRILNNNIGLIFILKGESISPETLQYIRKQNPTIKIIVYQWDSVNNNPKAVDLIRLADNAYTFDPVDANSLRITYLPLFSSWDEVGFNKDNYNGPVEYDILSIGGYRSHRIPYINIMKEFCENNGLTYKFHYYENFMSFLKNRNKFNIKISDVSFFKISYKHYYDLLIKSRVVFDIHSPLQSGLTMRTMETLSLNKKLITTNKNIIKEPFYNEQNIFIVNRPEDLKTISVLNFINSKSVKCEGILTLTEWLNKMGLL